MRDEVHRHLPGDKSDRKADALSMRPPFVLWALIKIYSPGRHQ